MIPNMVVTGAAVTVTVKVGVKAPTVTEITLVLTLNGGLEWITHHLISPSRSARATASERE